MNPSSVQKTILFSFKNTVPAKIFQCELSMISATDPIVSRMSSSTTKTLRSVLISSGCADTAMLFEWRSMLRRDGYLMRGSAEVGKEDDLYPLEEPNRGSPVID